MKLADSLNPATQAENIKKLNAGLEAVDAKTLPGTSTATTGQILKLTGENKTPSWADEYSYTPPAYSTTETVTGQKWIDGKEIYCKVFEFTTNTSSGTKYVGGISNIGKLINTITVLTTAISIQLSSFNSYTYVDASGNVINVASSEGSQNVSAFAILYYTKADPVPGDAKGPEDEEEPEEKKTTKKKATK